MLKFYRDFRFLITSIVIISVAFLSAGIVNADVLNVPSTDYETIQSAIDDAFPGDQIVIAEERYEEVLNIPKGSLEIVGAGVDKTVIVNRNKGLNTINFTTAGGLALTISGLSIEGGNNGIVSNAPLTLKEVQVIGTSNDGLNISGRATLNTVTITRAGGNGIRVNTNTSLSLTDGMITRSKENGIWANARSVNVIVRRTIITANTQDGVFANASRHGGTKIDLGTEVDAGNNEIYQNGIFNVRGWSNTGDSAAGNWWGTDSPQPEQFSGVTYEPFLTEPPISSFPAVRRVEPAGGSVAGGGVIQITGERFIAGATVTIGGAPATGVSVNSETQIIAVTPAGVEGSALLTVTNPDGGSASLQEAFTYVDIGGGQTSDTFEAEIPLTKGVNIFSLPLRPEAAVTASQLGTDLDATVVLRAVDGKFLVYVPDGDFGTDFPLEMGKGVIVNLLEPKTYKATGRAWGTPVIAAPVQSAATGTWAFVVAGQIDSSVVPQAKVHVMNLRTGESRVVPIAASGKFTAAFVDMSKQAVVTPGDAIITQLIDPTGTPLGDAKRHLISPDQIARANLKTRLSATPQQTQLLQNYPNPFNPETWIPFQLAGALSEVVIEIYDLNGRQIRRLDVGHRESGWYLSRDRAAYWDGKNSAGEKVSSGVYFYQITANGYRETRRMVILK